MIRVLLNRPPADANWVMCLRRFRDASYEAIEALQLDATQQAVMSMLHPRNLEVSIVGDFDAQLLERLVQRYLGTLTRAPPAQPLPTWPVLLQNPPVHQRRLSWHLQDSDERAAGYISGGSAACQTADEAEWPMWDF